MIEVGLKAASRSQRALVAVKVLHTAIWYFLAGCIVALPILGLLNHFRWAVLLMLPVMIETIVLIANDWNCPLGNLAGRYTDDRSPDFDIYLPLWLASCTKVLFGSLFVLNCVIVGVEWLRSSARL